MAGITHYERMRRQYGDEAVAMIHHIYNKTTRYFFKTELTMKTMDEYIDLMGGTKAYQPVRTYYIPLKLNAEEWEKEQYALANTDEPQKQKFHYGRA